MKASSETLPEYPEKEFGLLMQQLDDGGLLRVNKEEFEAKKEGWVKMRMEQNRLRTLGKR